jgi:16S rRNA (cytosine967-C5)-methyltransferase
MSDSSTLNLAARVLESVGEDAPADIALRRYLAGARHLRPPERRAISKAVFAVYRWLNWLDTSKSLQKRVADALALNERFARDPKSVKPEALAALAVPAWVQEEMTLPVEFLRQLQREPVLWLRARPGTAERLSASLGDCSSTPLAPDALRYTGSKDLFLTHEFHEGAFEIQDLASQIVGLACAPKPGETWWDACAGEGGKTLHLADLLENRGVVWATDRSVRRLEVLKHRAARARLFNTRTASWDGAAARLPFKTKFHGVLVDAPCTGVGTWRRNPHARWTTSPEDVRELSTIQRSLLATAAEAVAPGGLLIYSVCTLTRSETTDVTADFAANHPQFMPESRLQPGTPLAQAAGGNQTEVFLWPQALDANGMFLAAWRRSRN